MYIKYNALKEFLSSFEDCEEDLRLIALHNLIGNYFDRDVLLDIKYFDIYFPRDIIDDCIGYEKELIVTDVSEYIDKLLPVKLRHFNPSKDPKIFNLFWKSKEARNLSKQIAKYHSSIAKKTNLFEDIKWIESNINDLKIICFDFEAFEKKQHILTELGITILENGNYKSEHYIVKENLSYKNGNKVNDRRFNFNFGQSKTLPLHEIILILKQYLDNTDLIIGQGIVNDFDYAKRYLKNQDKLPKDFIAQKNYKVLDTHDLTFLFEAKGMGLQKTLEYFNILHRNLHNGGNDSRYNLMVFEKMINEIDISQLQNGITTLEDNLKQTQTQFSNNYKIRENIIVDNNIYKLDKSKRMLDIYFDTDKSILAKSDTVVSIKNKINIKSILLGGFFNSLIRYFFNSNSFYIQKINSDESNGVVSFANTTYEKMQIIEIDGRYNLNDGVFTLCDDTITLNRTKQSFKKAFFGATGGFSIENVSGKGRVVIAANGHIKKIDLKDEEIILDESHLLAWDDSLEVIENKSNSTIANIKSGEFFSSKISGTGSLYISSEKINRSIFSMMVTILVAIIGIAYSIYEISSMLK
jgi:uncharacterized protein (AIM24 family)